METSTTVSVNVKLFKCDTSWLQCPSTDGIKTLLKDSSICSVTVDSKSYLERVLIECGKKCGITPVYLRFFGLKDLRTQHWVNLNRTVEEQTKIGGNAVSSDVMLLEFRVRFVFGVENPGRGPLSTYCTSGSNEDRRPVYDSKTLLYLFHQRREDFRATAPDISGSNEDESNNLGLAVFDLFRLGCELRCDIQTVKSKVDLKNLLSSRYNSYLKSRGYLARLWVDQRFKYFTKQSTDLYAKVTESLDSRVMFHLEYIRYLESYLKLDHSETFLGLFSENTEGPESLKVGPYCGITEKRGKTSSLWGQLSDIADLHLTEGHESYNVTLVHVNGDTVSFKFSDKQEAEGLASCIDGYYHLLVDSHYYLCKKVCRPSLVMQLNQRCFGPIQLSAAQRALKSISHPTIFCDNVLRCSSVNYEEYFLAMLNEKLDVVAAKALNENGKFYICGNEQEKQFLDQPTLMSPPAKFPSPLMVEISRRGNEAAAKLPTDMTLITQDEYTPMHRIGDNRVTCVVLHSKKRNAAEKVVVKQLYELEEHWENNFLQGRFQTAMNAFYRINDWTDSTKANRNIHLVRIMGSMMHYNVILEYMPLGDIILYATHHTERPETSWFLSVYWQLAHACSYMEEKGFAHGNIRGKNVLLKRAYTHPFVKLSDPGVTTQKSKDNVIVPVLKPPWLAYEFCFPQSVAACNEPTINGDKWSYASTVCEIWKWGTLEYTLTENYAHGEVLPLPTELRSQGFGRFCDLLTACWMVRPLTRPAFRQIMREISDSANTLSFGNEKPEEGDEPIISQPAMSSMEIFEESNMVTIRPLGNGRFGLVELCEYRHGEERLQVAVKSIPNVFNHRSRREVYSEVEAMSRVDHRYVTTLLGVTFPSYRLVLEYLENGSLKEYLKTKRISGVPLVGLHSLFCNFSSQIAEGMQAVQEKGLLHRDLATRNILLAKDASGLGLYAKISDFGLTRNFSEETEYYQVNSQTLPLNWTAPESICEDYAKFYPSSDVWSYGVCIWEIFSYGNVPNYVIPKEFHGRNRFKRLYRYLQSGNRLPQPIDCPGEVFYLMLSCWKFNRHERPTFGELQQEFSVLAEKLNLNHRISRI